jgi:hypothetical protein
MAIVGQHAVSWVGSDDAPPDEFKWQLRLKSGERVVVIGEEQLQTYPGGPRELHYRIAPPAGEFRWIHESDVRHASQIKVIEPRVKRDIQLTDFRVVVGELETEPRRDGFVARKQLNSTTSTGDAGGGRDPVRRASQEAVVSQTDLPALTPAEFDERLRDLDLKLALAVAKPVDDWQLSDLSEDANELISRGPTTVDRGRAQLFVEKLDEFVRLRSRYQTAGITSRPASVDRTASSVQPARPTPSSGFDPRFDGVGWLYPVHSRNQASPPYALLDANGTILHFVSPAPGFNLHRYLRKEIGVFGHQAISASLDKPHVTAERVVSLARHRRQVAALPNGHRWTFRQ